MLAGCGSSRQIYEDIALSRSRSYQSWLGRRSRNSESTDVIRGELSLDECLGIALVNNKQIAAAIADKENARGKITESYSLALPKVNLNGSYTRLDEPPGAGFGSEDNYALGARLSQPLYRGGSIGAGMRAAKLYACMADERIKEVIQRVIFDVRKTYYDILLAHDLLRVSERAVELSQEHVKDVRTRREAGVASDYDVLRARVEVSNYEAEMIRNRNRLHLLETSFYKLLGVSQESEMEFGGELRYQAAEPSFEEAVRQAFADRPELIQAELEYRLYKENLIASKAERRPKLDLFFEESYAYPNPHDSTNMSWGDSWVAGATMSFPIFDGLSNRGRIRQARAELAKRRIQLSDREEAVLLDIKQAVLNIRDAESFVKSQEANVKRAAEGFELVKLGYREGVNTDLEVRDAQQALLRAESLHYQAIHQHQVAVLGLEKATGSLQPPGETPKDRQRQAPKAADVEP